MLTPLHCILYQYYTYMLSLLCPASRSIIIRQLTVYWMCSSFDTETKRRIIRRRRKDIN